MSDVLTGAGFEIVAQLEREAIRGEKDPQAFIIGVNDAQESSPDSTRSAPA